MFTKRCRYKIKLTRINLYLGLKLFEYINNNLITLVLFNVTNFLVTLNCIYFTSNQTKKIPNL